MRVPVNFVITGAIEIRKQAVTEIHISREVHVNVSLDELYDSESNRNTKLQVEKYKNIDV